MDKPDLDFIIDSEDNDLLYKHVLEAICSSSRRVRDGIFRYMVHQIIIHNLSTCILYRSKYDVNIKRIDKYAMELQ